MMYFGLFVAVILVTLVELRLLGIGIRYGGR